MTHRSPTISRLIKAFLLLGLLTLSAPPLLALDSVLIIKSSDNRFFNTTIEHLINNTQEQANFDITTLQALREEKSSLSEARLIVTLGNEAAVYMSTIDKGVPILRSYLTEFQHNSLDAKPNHHSLLLEQPLERYARFIKDLLSIDNIGIVRSKNNLVEKRSLLQLRLKFGIKINQSVFTKGDNAVNIVRDLLKDNDALLTLPAPEIYNRQSLKGILLASYRLNKPVISYSPAHVKSGALAAIFTSPENIGKQLAVLVNQLLSEKDFVPKPSYYPAEFDISINNRVARSLDLELPDTETLLNKLRQRESLR